jgi:hypothetical protein
MKITVTNAQPGRLLLCGMPFAQGCLTAGSGLRLLDGNDQSAPVWWSERAHWPDGSVKWVFLHARLISASQVLSVVPCSDAPVNLPAAAVQVLGGGHGRVLLGSLELELASSGWCLRDDQGQCRIAPTQVITEPAREQVGAYEFTVLEPSPIAPLLRLRQHGDGGLRLDHLLRLDPQSRSLDWQQRLSFLGDAPCELRMIRTSLELEAGEWRWDVDSGLHSSLAVPGPGAYVLDGGAEQRGRPRVGLRGEGGSVEVLKAWQRSPLTLELQGSSLSIGLYPEDAAPLTVQPGTSYRHPLRISLSRDGFSPACWQLDPEAACASGALGPLMARTGRTQQLYPGYEQAMGLCLRGGRLTRLDKERGQDQGEPAALDDEQAQDVEYFGLQHYGDWPMKLGSYGGTTRMYADNEYDTPYTYYLQFLRTGEPVYRSVAYWCAVHMADVDSKATNGDMRFHGYNDTAEDHGAHRSPGGELGHYWTDGMVLNYLLSDDIWSWEAALAQAQLLLQHFAGEGDEPIRRCFQGCERAVGWPLTALAGVAEVTGDPEILAKLRQMTGFLARFAADPDRELEEVATVLGQPLRWWRVGQQDGSKPFMLGVVLEGLERYHRLTGDPAAGEAVVDISRFLVDVMWAPGIEAFIYEWNAYNRAHREDSYPHYINMMVAPGLAFAYELTGEACFRDVATRAFHAALWTLVSPGGGKEIGMVGRTSSLMVGRLHQWLSRDQQERAARMSPSNGIAFTFAGAAAELAQQQQLIQRAGRPRFIDGALDSHGDSFQVLGFREPVNTDHGVVEFSVVPDWDCPAHPGPVAQRAYLHLSDRPFTRSCVSIISFYTGLHVRFYDAERHYIEVLETDIQHWKAGQEHRVRVVWDGTAGTAELWMDGELCDRRGLPRRLAGAFKRLHVGHRPGNWRSDGRISDLRLELGG